MADPRWDDIFERLNALEAEVAALKEKATELEKARKVPTGGKGK